MLFVRRRIITTLRRLRRNRNTSLPRRLSLVAIDRAGILPRAPSLRSTTSTRSRRNHNRGLRRERNRRVPNSIGVDIAVVSPKAGDGDRQSGRRQQLRLVVVPDGHLFLGHVPERRLVQHDGVVEAAEVGVRGDLLVARVAFALRDGAHGFVRVHAEVVEVGEVELVVFEEGAETADGGDLVRVDGDDGVVDCGAAAVDAAHVAEGDGDCWGRDGDSFGDEGVGGSGG